MLLYWRHIDNKWGYQVSQSKIFRSTYQCIYIAELDDFVTSNKLTHNINLHSDMGVQTKNHNKALKNKVAIMALSNDGYESL